MSVDLVPNDQADMNVVLKQDADWEANTKEVSQLLDNKSITVDSMINVAGGWGGGSAADANVFQMYDSMLDMNLRSAVCVAHLATKHLSSEGLVVLTGAVPVLKGGTGGMLSYGISKAGVHHIVKSLAAGGGLPESAKAICVLPTTIDTPSNRANMPKADYNMWTRASVMADTVFQWSDSTATPPENTDSHKYYPTPALENGAFYSFTTKVASGGSYDFINDEMVAFRDLTLAPQE